MTLDRRAVLAAAPAILLYGRAAAALGDNPFTFGVASGEPAPDGMVLWTRLATQPLTPDGGMPARAIPLRWEVYEDEVLRRLARAGRAAADPAFGHSVHVEVAGLRPGRPYWYRFLADGIASPVGCTRTAPASGAPVDRLRVCFASCQKYEAGYYAAWTHAVADTPDLILFLGDYIYEADPDPKALRPHRNPEPVDLAGYRVRYATYRLDPLLQAAHAAAPWVVTWDDHEVANDYAGLLSEMNAPIDQFRRRRAAAYQAYYEFMPLRAAQRPTATEMRLYRTLDWGRLAQFQIVDDRQYRGARACQPPERLARHRKYLSLTPDCAGRHDPGRSILGTAQERWLGDALGHTQATWNILAQQTLMMPYRKHDPGRLADGAIFYSEDTWSGFPEARERILARWQAAKVSNPLVMSGDIHSFAAGELYSERGDGAPVAPEFVGGSITSLEHDATLRGDMMSQHGFRFAENAVRGYGRADLTPGRCDVTFRGLADARDPRSAARDLARFTVEAGSPRIRIA